MPTRILCNCLVFSRLQKSKPTQSLHKAYTKPTLNLHKAYMILRFFGKKHSK